MNVLNYRLWLMWAVAVFFFAYQFVMRVTPGLVMPELMQKFQIDAASFGLFASAYYVGYAGMQIPVALFLDRYGPKKVISLCALLCSLGTLALVYTNHWGFALLSRFIIGAGSAAGFLGASKIISLWFPEKIYTKMVGITFTFGLVGALYGGKPISAFISAFGWEAVLTWVGILGFGVALILFLLIQDSETKHKASNISTWQNLKIILTNKRLCLIALANLLMVGALEGFADVWGVPYLVAVRGISKSDAALFTSTIFFGMLFGGPLLAYLAEKLRSEVKVTSLCGYLMASLFIVMLITNNYLPSAILYVLLFAIGILCCYQVLIFSIGVRMVPSHLSGLTVAFLNCMNMLGGSFFHNMIGQCMDLFWTGAFEHQIRVYDTEVYIYALYVIPIAAIVGSGMLMWVNKAKQFSYQKVSVMPGS